MPKLRPIIAALVLAAFAVPSLAKKTSSEFSPKEIYKMHSPAVVLIMGLGRDGAGEMGTGSVVDGKGRVLTNAHVVIRASTGQAYDTIRVYLKPAKISGDPQQDLVSPIEAKVKSFDRGLDLAILELESVPPNLPVVPLRDSTEVDSGEPVVAIGHPEQGGLWTLTQGVVSTVISNLGGVKGKNVFQTDASINRGNSGGPLLSRRGGLIGVNTSMARKAADGLTITSVNFAVKSEVVKGWLARTGEQVEFVQVAGNPPVAEAEEPSSPPKPAEAVSEAPAPSAKPAERPVVQAKPARTPAGKTPPAEPPAVPEPPATPDSPATPESPAKILTPKKPFSIADLIAREIAEMEDLETEMRGEIEKRKKPGAP